MRRYPEEVQRYISDNVKGTTTKDLVKMVNEKFGTEFTESKMKSYKTNHKLKSDTFRGVKSGYSGIYSQKIIDFIRINYKGISTKELTEKINTKFQTYYTERQILYYKKNHKLNSGLTGRFEKGHVPDNKGKKKYWVGGEATQFKKGNIPVNYRPIGSERITVDGYIEIKVADPNKWKLKHRIIWENTNGKIPEGSIIIFLDGNSLNLDIENLKCITKAQNARLNQMNLNGTGKESVELALIIADIQSLSTKRAKESGINLRKLSEVN